MMHTKGLNLWIRSYFVRYIFLLLLFSTKDSCKYSIKDHPISL